MVETGDLSGPSAGWQALAQNYMSSYQSIRREGYLPDGVHVPGAKAVRDLRAVTTSAEIQFRAK